MFTKKNLQEIRPANLGLSFRKAAKYFAEKYLINEKSIDQLLAKASKHKMWETNCTKLEFKLKLKLELELELGLI